MERRERKGVERRGKEEQKVEGRGKDGGKG